jgi:hypothetical protein
VEECSKEWGTERLEAEELGGMAEFAACGAGARIVGGKGRGARERHARAER